MPDGGFGVGGGVVGEGEGGGGFGGEGAAADGAAFEGEEFEGGAAVVVEALAEAGVLDGEGFVFLLEGEGGVLGLAIEEVTDGASSRRLRARSISISLFMREGASIGARSWGGLDVGCREFVGEDVTRITQRQGMGNRE